MDEREQARAEALALVARYWEGLIRPSLRTQADRMTERHGRRPAPGEMVALIGLVADMRAVLRPGLIDETAEFVCVVVGREAGLRERLEPTSAVVLEIVLSRVAPTALPLVWVQRDGFDVVPMHNVIDTGPEGAAINSPPARGPAS